MEKHIDNEIIKPYQVISFIVLDTKHVGYTDLSDNLEIRIFSNYSGRYYKISQIIDLTYLEGINVLPDKYIKLMEEYYKK